MTASKIYHWLSVSFLIASMMVLLVFESFPGAIYVACCAIYMRMVADKQENIEAFTKMKGAGFEGLFIMDNRDEKGNEK